MRIRSEVTSAKAHAQGVVALETTLISHGRGYPENLAIGRALEQAVRSEGGVPATVGILSGEVVIGVEDPELEHFARTPTIRKCTRRDVPILLARKMDGATTVCGTMLLAHQAGIRVFVTGGIGGVNRGHPFDVSADLQELARTPMVTVCSGCKALLDIEATREMLETYGVPVIGFGTDEFPGFYSRESGLPVDVRLETAQEVAEIAQERDRLGLTSALLVCVPVPEADALPLAEVEQAVAEVVRRADAQGIRGRDVTPFLLKQLGELTAGRTGRALDALLLNNARVAARIATALAR